MCVEGGRASPESPSDWLFFTSKYYLQELWAPAQNNSMIMLPAYFLRPSIAPHHNSQNFPPTPVIDYMCGPGGLALFHS